MSNHGINELGFDDHQEVNGRRNGLNAPLLNTNDILGPASKVSKDLSGDDSFGRIELPGLRDEDPVRREVTSLFQQAARSGLLNQMVDQVNKDLPQDHVAERVGCGGSPLQPKCAFIENKNFLSIVTDGNTQIDGQAGVRLAVQIDRKLGSVQVQETDQTKPMQASQVPEAAKQLRDAALFDGFLSQIKPDGILAEAKKGNQLEALIAATNKLMEPRSENNQHKPKLELEVSSDKKSVSSVDKSYPDHIDILLR